MRIKLLILYFLLSISVFAQQWHTRLDIRRPAYYRLPSDINDLLVVNNTVSQPHGLGHSNLRDNRSLANSEINIDEAPTAMLFAVVQQLEYNVPLRDVGVLIESQNKNGSFYMPRNLTPAEVKNLCQTYRADALLVLNQLVVYDKQEDFLTTEGDYYAYLQVYLNSNLVLMYPDGKTVNYNYADTLLWDNQDDSRYLALQDLPNRREAIIDMAAYCGERFANLFVEHWETVDRYMYDDDSEEMAQAMLSFRYRRFEQAANQWIQIYNNVERKEKSRKSLQRAYAAANAAVTFEMMDNLEQANLWTNNAIEALQKVNTPESRQQTVNLKYYKQQIEQRINELDKLY